MKYIPPVFLTLALSSSAFAEQPQLTKKSNVVTPVAAQSIETNEKSARSRSVVLSDGDNWTLVPRSSIIHRGHMHEGRLEGRPVGVLCSWQQFLSLNHSWLVGMEKEDYQSIATESPNSLDLEPRVVIALESGKPIPLTK